MYVRRKSACDLLVMLLAANLLRHMRENTFRLLFYELFALMMVAHQAESVRSKMLL